ncbi:L,D-transpeptidase [Pseudogemmobacter faecipullorum]|nr:L,D-transpeptidase [Pseudogemmobacter faecipullorum]
MRIPSLATLSTVNFRGSLTKAPVALLTSALLLSACVDTMTGEQLVQPQLAEQPEITTDPTIYAARSDGKFAIPAVPVEQIPESHRRQVVAYESDQPPGTIIIDPRYKLLYYVLGDGKAIRYGISVGAEGFQWSGESIVSNKRQWPTWTPPSEMIDRKPSLEKWRNGQPGGPTNPLGSRAIYLTSGGRDYGYRIHGTPEWKTIGRNASSGCFRMINQDVMDLYERVKGGEKVIVLTASGEMPKGLNIPKPPAPKKKAEPKPAAVTPAVTPPMIGPMIGPSLPAAPAAAESATPAAGSNTAPAAPGQTVIAPSTAPASTVPAANAPASPAPAATAPASTAPAATAPAAPLFAPAETATPPAVTAPSAIGNSAE